MARRCAVRLFAALCCAALPACGEDPLGDAEDAAGSPDGPAGPEREVDFRTVPLPVDDEPRPPAATGALEALRASPGEMDPGNWATVAVDVRCTGLEPREDAQVVVERLAPDGAAQSLATAGLHVLPGATAVVSQAWGPLDNPGTWTFLVSLRDAAGRVLDPGPAGGVQVVVRNPRPAWDQILDVGYDPQDTGYTCGPTSLSMVLAWHGVWHSEAAIASATGAYPYGVGRETLRDYVRYSVGGFWSDVVTGWDALKGEIAAGRPAVAHLGFNSADGDRGGGWPIATDGTVVAYSFDGGHYVVVVGLVSDGAGGVSEVVCNDPADWRGAYGNHVHYTASSFENAWTDDSGVWRDRHIVTVYRR
jgi:hypothetical protein